MKIEYLKNGSPDCPLVRIYGENKEEWIQLKSSFSQLTQGHTSEVSIHHLKGFVSIDRCEVTAELGQRDIGITETDNNKFRCILTNDTWDNIEYLLTPFCNGKKGFQWLDETSNISLLISTSGMW